MTNSENLSIVTKSSASTFAQLLSSGADIDRLTLLGDFSGVSPDFSAAVRSSAVRALTVGSSKDSSFRKPNLGFVAAACLSSVLQRLDVMGVELEREEVAAFAQALGMCVSLERVKFDNCGLKTESATEIISGIAKSGCKEMRSVNFHINEPGGRGGVELAEKLAEALSGSRDLRELQLYYRGVGAKGAAALGRKVVWRNVEYLNLWGNELRDEGLSAVVDGLLLHRPSALRCLVLCSARFGPKGAEKLAQLLRHAPRLSFLYIRSNPIGPAAGAVLGNALRGSKSLAKIDVSKCQLGAQGVANLFSLLGITRLAI